MEKYLKQFAPFVALVVAAALVVIADPADQGEAEVAGRLATRDQEQADECLDLLVRHLLTFNLGTAQP